MNDAPGCFVVTHGARATQNERNNPGQHSCAAIVLPVQSDPAARGQHAAVSLLLGGKGKNTRSPSSTADL